MDRSSLETRFGTLEHGQFRLEARVEELSRDMTTGNKQLSEYLGKIEDEFNKRFVKMDERFDKVETDIASMKGRLDKMDGRLDKMDERLDKMGTDISNMTTSNLSIINLLTQLVARLL